MKKIAFVLAGLVAMSSTLYADSWNVSDGTLKYTAKHLFKTINGTSHEVRGRIVCTPACQLLIASPIQSFDSENASRDTHMQEVMKAAQFPVVEVRAKRVNISPGSHRETVFVRLANKKHEYTVETHVEKTPAGITVKTEVPFNLTDYDLEKPSLLGTSIDDLVPVAVKLNFQHL